MTVDQTQMIRPFAFFFLTCALAGCASLHHHDLRFIGAHNISGSLYTKMSHHEPLTVDEIIELWRKGIPGPFIVHYLKPTYYVYKLSGSDVVRLRAAGVDEGVTNYLLATPGLYSPTYAPVWSQDNYNTYDTNPGLAPY